MKLPLHNFVGLAKPCDEVIGRPVFDAEGRIAFRVLPINGSYDHAEEIIEAVNERWNAMQESK